MIVLDEANRDPTVEAPRRVASVRLGIGEALLRSRRMLAADRGLISSGLHGKRGFIFTEEGERIRQRLSQRRARVRASDQQPGT
jgi:hypothetical protein